MRAPASFALLTIATLSINVHATNFDTDLLAIDRWSGNYAGISIGSRSVNGDWTTKSYEAPSGTALTFGTNHNANLDSDNFYYNTYIGYNWHIKHGALVGIELSLGNANNEKTHITIPGAKTDAPPDFSFIKLESSLESSLRGRIGYLISPSLHIYGGLGVAATEINISVTCPADTNFCNPAFGTISSSKTKTLTGWVANIGLEGNFQENAFWRLEYSHADYGNVKFSGLPSIPGESYGFTSELAYSSDILMLGLGYRF
jgi:outer membrane immunogenic protein